VAPTGERHTAAPVVIDLHYERLRQAREIEPMSDDTMYPKRGRKAFDALRAAGSYDDADDVEW
jgi:hypothetical protein